MIISTDAKQVFEKTQYHFMIKILKNLGIEVNFLNLTRTSTKTPHLTLGLSVKDESFPPEIRSKSRMSALTNSIQHYTKLSSQELWQEKGTKGTQVGQKEVILSLFIDDMILYTENSKENTHTQTFKD